MQLKAARGGKFLRRDLRRLIFRIPEDRDKVEDLSNKPSAHNGFITTLLLHTVDYVKAWRLISATATIYQLQWASDEQFLVKSVAALSQQSTNKSALIIPHSFNPETLVRETFLQPNKQQQQQFFFMRVVVHPKLEPALGRGRNFCQMI